MRFEKVTREAFRKDMLKHGFTEESIHDSYDCIRIPERKTAHSAGYDFVTPITFVLKPHEQITIPSGIKCYFSAEESERYHLELHVRSSVGIVRQVVLSNGTGVIDSDYHNNNDNEGDILISLLNRGSEVQRFYAGERIMQGILVPHGIVEGDNAKGQRTGGVGSTNEN